MFQNQNAKLFVWNWLKCFKLFPCLRLYSVWLELVDWAGIPLLIVLVEVERGVPEGGVHVDVLLHRLEDWVGGGVPIQVPVFKVQGTRYKGSQSMYLSSLLILVNSSTASVTTASSLIVSCLNRDFVFFHSTLKTVKSQIQFIL